MSGVNVLFIAGFGPISTGAESKKLYVDTLGLPLKPMADSPGYFHGAIDGVKHFAIWPLDSAAQSCFGASEWPANRPTPTSWLEFDVEDVAAASRTLKAKGYELLVENRQEPWGQTVTRLLSPEGVLVGLCFTPWMRS